MSDEDKTCQVCKNFDERFCVDKSDWPEGPWLHEPDFEQGTLPEHGYAYRAARAQSGALCGYVGVSAAHPAFGVHYDELHEKL